MISSILWLVQEFKTYVQKRTKNLFFKFDIKDRLLKFSVVVLDMIMEGTVSQNFYLGPSCTFM